MVEITLSAYSTTLTSAPNLWYTEPSSKPITPPPITTRCLGISVKVKASVEDITRFLSISIPGKLVGLLPVAITIFLAEIVSFFSPSIWIVLASTNDPIPKYTSTLFFFIRKSTPFVIWSTTPCLRAIICLKSILGVPMLIP